MYGHRLGKAVPVWNQVYRLASVRPSFWRDVLGGDVLGACRGNTMHDSSPNHAEHTYPDPLRRDVKQMCADPYAHDKDDVANDINSKRHLCHPNKDGFNIPISLRWFCAQTHLIFINQDRLQHFVGLIAFAGPSSTECLSAS